MEPITHFLTGACLGRSGFNRKSALATATMVIAAELPDVDFAWWFKGPISYFSHHRGWTHSLAGAPVMAAATVALMYLYDRLWRRRRVKPGALPVRWGYLFFLALLADLSHILLDFTNNYGVRPFEPLNWRWYSWDIVFIYDPVLWAILFVGLVAPALFGLISEEVGARQRGPRGRGGAIFALVCVVLFYGLRDYEHRRAVTALDSLTYHDEDALRVSAYPYAGNPFTWHGVVETHDFFAMVPVDTLHGDVDPQDRERIRYKPEETPVTLAAKNSYAGRVYLSWAQYPITEVEQRTGPDAGYEVRFYDLRYEYPGRDIRPLSSTVELDQRLRPVLFRWGPRTEKPPH